MKKKRSTVPFGYLSSCVHGTHFYIVYCTKSFICLVYFSHFASFVSDHNAILVPRMHCLECISKSLQFSAITASSSSSLLLPFKWSHRIYDEHFTHTHTPTEWNESKEREQTKKNEHDHTVITVQLIRFHQQKLHGCSFFSSNSARNWLKIGFKTNAKQHAVAINRQPNLLPHFIRQFLEKNKREKNWRK